jgi:cytidine diphosphoramidate kinase
MVIWLIGLSGAGKSTLGRELVAQWRRSETNTVMLDGDEIRHIFGNDNDQQAYTVEGRRRNAERMVGLCEWLDRQGMNVVCCILSLFPDMRAENRLRFSAYFEVFLDAPMAVLEARDVKGLYAARRAGTTDNVVGIDIPFDRPETPDMVIDTSGTPGVAEIRLLAREVLGQAGRAP